MDQNGVSGKAGRLCRLDGNRMRASAALRDLRERDAQFAVGERGARARHVDGMSQPDAASEAAESALDQVKRRFDVWPPRPFLADDQERIAFGDDSYGARVDARQIDHHFNQRIRLEDVHSG